jgi:hypothetical protein
LKTYLQPCSFLLMQYSISNLIRSSDKITVTNLPYESNPRYESFENRSTNRICNTNL